MSYERPSSIRFPAPLRQRLKERAAAERRTFSNTVVVLLEDALDREPASSPLVGEELGAEKLVADLARRGLGAAEIAEATGLPPDAVAAVHERGR